MPHHFTVGMGANNLSTFPDIGDQHNFTAGMIGVLTILGTIIFANLAEITTKLLLIGGGQLVLIADDNDEMIKPA